MTRPRFLCDVDGPAAAMQEAFVDWANKKFSLNVQLDDIVYHNDMGRSPALRAVDEWLRREHYPIDGPDGGWGGAFIEFMRQPDVYTRFIGTTVGAKESLATIRERYDVAFVTSLMKRANVHVPNKLDWVGQNFPGIPIMTVPSEVKHWVPGAFATDDRYDTCERWRSSGTTALLFGYPWNEAPPEALRFDWPRIVTRVMEDDRG